MRRLLSVARLSTTKSLQKSRGAGVLSAGSVLEKNAKRSSALNEGSTRTVEGSSSLNSFSRRTHNCGELRLSNVGEAVELFGWLAFKRFNKFLVVRDAYGTTQATVADGRVSDFAELINRTHYESAVRIRGRVADRGERNRNGKMATGDVEVVIDELEVLNGAPERFPVFSGESNDSAEAVRLKYRYLDLRSERMQHTLRFRASLQHRMRRFLAERCGFVEVETPTLAQWTPGGAAEFVVPAPRPNRGRFFTLPQSPQIYKQLLMCGSIDRYFQIARCYRNEGSKSDRQPEFTQVDLELSFTTQEHVLSLVERLIVESWPDELADHRPMTSFRRISYADAVERYGTDKPDLRGKGSRKFEFLWVVDFPLFTPKENIDDGKSESFESTHHPFTAPVDEHVERLKACRRLADIRAQHYDLVLNGVELGGGSIRIHDASLQRHVFERVLKIPTATLEPFIEALSYGAPPHGGFALGLDRYAQLLVDETWRRKVGFGGGNPTNNNNSSVCSIRDVIAFPKTKNTRCAMLDAPTLLPPDLYRQYGVNVTEDEEERRSEESEDESASKK